MRKTGLLTVGRYIVLLFIALCFHRADAQYLFTESFANPAVLSRTGWDVYSPQATVFRDNQNAFSLPGNGALHVSFTDMGSGVSNTLTLPGFTATGTGDSLSFEHAHRARLTASTDSVAIFSSADNGLTYTWLTSYLGDEVPAPHTLSTSAGSTSRDRFVPGGREWDRKTVALPAGTNKIRFVFYSGGGDELYIDNIMIGKDPVFCSVPVIGNPPVSFVTCAGQSLIITLDSFQYDPYVTYNWQRSLDSGVTDPWVNTDNTGFINSPDFFLENITQPAYYRLEAVCSVTGVITTSAATHVLFDSAYNCYCRTSLGGACNSWITHVSIDGTSINNNSTCNSTDVDKYTYYAPSATTSDSITAGDPSVTINIGTELFHPTLDGKVGFWIDYDRNGTFDSLEFSLVNDFIPQAGTTSYTFSVPVDANPGYAGLRIRTVEGRIIPFNGSEACSLMGSGETEDYLIYIKPAPVCSGSPVAGTLSTTTPVVCFGSAVTVVSEGLSFGDGITYEWEESRDNGVTDVWATATGASGINTHSLRVAYLSDSMYYRLKVTCTHSLEEVYSTPILIAIKPIFECYCNANLGGSQCTPGTPYISNVTIEGSDLNNSSLCSGNANSYTSFGFLASAFDTFSHGELITLSVTNTVAQNKVGVWIDYNHDLDFDNTEFMPITLASAPDVPSTINILIPTTADTGFTGMRIRAIHPFETMTGSSACNNFASGETEDYIIYIKPADMCTSMPEPGTVPAQVSVCQGSTTTLTARGTTYGPSIFYQWEQSSDAGITEPWADVTTGAGQQERELTTGTITDTTYFRLRVTCMTTGEIAYSDTIEVVLGTFNECYCNDNLGAGFICIAGEYISNVSFIGGNLNNTSTCSVSGGTNNYSRFLPTGTATDTVIAGDNVTLSVTFPGQTLSSIGAWIDYDHSGTFDPSEYTHLGATTSASATVVNTFTIPATALTGQTGMRIRTHCASCAFDSTDACTNFNTGEVEDYIITIKAATPCSGTPAPGVLPSSNLICPNKPFELTPRGYVFNSGVTYQWEMSADNGATDPWTAVPGAENHTLTSPGITAPVYFRLKAVCVLTSDSTYTNAIQFFTDSFYNCYDANVDLGGGQCSFNTEIQRVSITNTTLDNASACNVTPFGSRSVFPATGSSTATLLASLEYEVNVASTGLMSMGFWIDYDRNGTFDPTEFTLVTNFSVGTVTLSTNVTIPATATPGLTGMRIRTDIAGGMIAAHSAAAKYSAGETEDYVIMIDTLRPASNVSITHISAHEATVSWTNGNGHARVVLAKESTTPLTDPQDGDAFGMADNIFASGNGDSTAAGNYIVYNGDRDTFVTVSGLNTNTQYDFYVYEYLNVGRSTKYALPGQTTTGTTLPVKLLSFTAATAQQDVVLNWITASENNNKGFGIEKQDANGTWKEIGFAEGKGTSSQKNQYFFTDRAAFATGISSIYYRLRQEDTDGKTAYSRVVKAVNKQTGTAVMNVYPNPFSETITLDINATEQTTLHIAVKDVSGKTVATLNATAAAGHSSVTVDQLSELAAGIYFIQVNYNGSTEHFKVIRSTY
jgi:hypothetical protein